MISRFCVSPHRVMHVAFPCPLCFVCQKFVRAVPNKAAHTGAFSRESRASCTLLTLVVNVLVLVHFPIHVRMRVRVDISVDLGVDLGSQASAALSQEQLLMSNVLLVRKTIFVAAGRLSGQPSAGALTVARR